MNEFCFRSPGPTRLSMKMIGQSDISESESESSGKYLVEERGKARGKGKKPIGLKRGTGKMGKRMRKADLL